MRELIEIAEGLADVFDRLGVRYAFGGALANNFWGTVRATQALIQTTFVIPGSGTG